MSDVVFNEESCGQRVTATRVEIGLSEGTVGGLKDVDDQHALSYPGHTVRFPVTCFKPWSM